MISLIERRPLVVLTAGAAAISLAPILVKAAAQWNVGPNAIAFWRCAMATGMLVILTLLLRQPLAVPRRLALLLIAAGVAFAVDLIVWHQSIFLAGAGMATILGNTQVFFTALLATIFFRERLSLRFLFAAACALAGLTLLVGIGSDVDFSPAYVRGVAFGLATGVAYGVFLTLLRTGALHASPAPVLTRLTWVSGFAALALLAPVVGGAERATPDGFPGWVALASLALVAQSLGWWMISSTVGRVPASIAGLVLLAQPVLATVWSALLFDERLLPLQILGALITLAAIYAGSVRR